MIQRPPRQPARSPNVAPRTTVIAVGTNPTTMLMRAPYRSRLSSSRARLSVPRGYSGFPCSIQIGGVLLIAVGGMMSGSWGASSGAATATSNISRMKNAPTRAAVFRRNRRQASHQRPRGLLGAKPPKVPGLPVRFKSKEIVLQAPITEPLIARLDARIGETVSDIHRKIGKHDDSGVEERSRHNDGVVAGGDAVDKEIPHSRNAEDALDDDRSRYEPSQCRPQDGDNRQH